MVFKHALTARCIVAQFAFEGFIGRVHRVYVSLESKGVIGSVVTVGTFTGSQVFMNSGHVPLQINRGCEISLAFATLIGFEFFVMNINVFEEELKLHSTIVTVGTLERLSVFVYGVHMEFQTVCIRGTEFTLVTLVRPEVFVDGVHMLKHL